MPRIEDTALMRDIKSGNFYNVYFLYGKELYLLEKALAALTKKALGGNLSDFNYQKFDSRKTPIEDIQNAADALPFMAERKCIVINNLDVEAMGSAQYDKLKALIENSYDGCMLIFYLSGFEINPKKQAKWRAFSALCEKHGCVTEFALKDKNALAKALCARAAQRGCTLQPANATRLVDICGSALNVLYNEVDKLCDFAGEGAEITRAHIDQSATPSIESTSFDLARAVVRKDYGRAFALLDELFYQRISPIDILGALSSSFVDLYRAKAAISAGVNAQTMTADFAYAKNVTFRVNNAMRDCRNASIEQMRTYITALITADEKLKSTGTDKKIVLEELLGKMIAADRTR